MVTYFITGISGFLGKNITLQLLEKDVKIVGFVLPNDKEISFYKNYPNVTLVEGDLLKKDDVKKFLSTPHEGKKIVIHSAGYISTYKRHDKRCMGINVNGTKNIVDVCLENKDVDKLVYVSSVDAIKRAEGNEDIFEPKEYNEKEAIGVYSKSKTIASKYVMDACEKGLDASIAFPSVILGPNDPLSAPINVALKKYLNNKLPAVVKGGYDMVDVRDVANGIILISEKGKKGESYLLTGTHISVTGFINIAAKIENRKPFNKTIPLFLIYIVSPFIELFARLRKRRPLFTSFAMGCLTQNSNYNHQKATQELGYNHRDLEITVRDTIEWMKSTDYLSR